MEQTHDKTSASFALRRSPQPYLALPIIILLISLLWSPYVTRTKDWGPLEALGAAMIFPALFAWYGTRYRIWWRDGEILQRAADGPVTIVKVADIYKIDQERSNLHTLLSMRRPSRRITIYGETPQGPRNIDISLKDFKTDDILKLMRAIHEKRPDLPMPNGWLDGREVKNTP